MSEQDNIPSELQLLKERADLMKIKYHPNIGVDKLRAKVNGVLSDDKNEDTDVTETAPEEKAAPKKLAVKHKSIAQLKQEMVQEKRREANKLVRIVVSCMNPNKKDYPGEIFTVSNSIVGTIKKYVPFNVEAGYHVPYIIYMQLKERKYQSFTKKRLPNGSYKVEGKLVPELNVQVLDALTPVELKDLAQRQALNHSIDQKE